MKVKHYNEMMAYLTRPGFNGGGSVSNNTVLPKRKPAAEVKKRKKINYEKIKQYLGKESQDLVERELGFAIGGGVSPNQLKQRFMEIITSIQEAEAEEVPMLVAEAKDLKDKIDELNKVLSPERQIQITAQGIDFDNPLLDAAKIAQTVDTTQEVTGGLTKNIAKDVVPESLTTDNPAFKGTPDYNVPGALGVDEREKIDAPQPGKQVGINPRGNAVQASMRAPTSLSDMIRGVLKKFDKEDLTATEGSFADGGRIGFEPGGKVQLRNQAKLDKVKELILAYNNDPKALYDTTGKMKASKVVTKNGILIEAGFKKGMLSTDARTGLGKAVNKEIDKLLKPAQKFENYMNNVMLAEDALAKDFINPREHIAKKFGISYDSEQVKNFFRDNKTVKENKKLFKTVLSQKLARELYAFAPDGSPRTMAEVSELVANKLPTKFGIIVKDSPHKFILESARRNFLKSQKLGLEPKVTFITNPETTAPRDLVFIDNETNKLYSSNLQEDFFDFRGQKYKNNYLLKDNARQIYPEFENVYKIFENDIPEYKKATITINGKEKNLDQYYRDKYAKESNRKSYYTRRSAEVDHGNLLDDPFGRKNYGLDQGGIRLIGARENKQAGMLMLNKSKNLKENLEKIEFINNDQSTTDFINRMRNNATKPGVAFRGGESIVLGMNRINPELLDVRKLPDDFKNLFKDIPLNLIKTPKGKKILRKIIKGGKFTGAAAAGEVAFALPFALSDYAAGLEPKRILGEATLGIAGQTEQEEIKKATGELGYATQLIDEYQSTLDSLDSRFNNLTDSVEDATKKQSMINLYTYTAGKLNKEVGRFYNEKGEFNKGLYKQALNNYKAGTNQIGKFQEMKAKQREGFSTGLEGIDLNFLPTQNMAGGGIAKEAGDESGPPPESGPTPQGLASIIKRGRKY
jgi:hypothetical protein